jgi:hypothetical protein
MKLALWSKLRFIVGHNNLSGIIMKRKYRLPGFSHKHWIRMVPVMDHSRERSTRMPNRCLPPSLAGLASLMFLLGSISLCFADGPPPPAYLSLPAQAQLKANWIQEDYGEAAFNIIGQPEPTIQAGKHWSAACTLSGVPSGMDVEEMWQKLLKPSLVQGGWVFFRDAPGQAKTARYQKNGKDSWVQF